MTTRWPSRGILRPALTGRALVAQVIGNTGLNSATFVLNFAIALLLSRVLGAVGYGAYAFAVAWAMLLTVPAALGLSPLLVREIVTYRVHEDWPHIRGILRRTNEAVFAASMIVVSSAAAIVWVAGWPESPLLLPSLLALPLVPLLVLTTVRQSTMQGLGRVVLGRSPEALVSPILFIGLIAALVLALGDRISATWAVGAHLVSAALAALLGVVLLRRTVPEPVRDTPSAFETRRWARAALPLVLFSGIQVVNSQIGIVLLGALSGAGDAGVFGVANRAAGVVPFLLIASSPALMPAVAGLHARNESARLQALLTRSARLVLLGSIPFAIGVLVFADPLLSIFGSEFSSGITSMRILAFGQLVNVLTGFAGMVLVMTGDTARMTRSVAAGTALNVFLCVILIRPFGIEGAAIASAVSIGSTNLLLTFELWRSQRLFAPAFGVKGFRR